MNKQKRLNRRRFFRERIPVYQSDPVTFSCEVLRFEPDKWQRDVLRDIAESPKVAVKSGQGVGKTSVEAVALLWFLSCFPFPRVVATAPTKQQLHDVLWSEASKWMERSPLLRNILKWTKTYIYMDGYEKQWFAVARTATKPENMQGFHEDNMLFIVDEASGVADPIMEAILGTLSGENNKLLLCGNPTKTSGTFFDAFNSDLKLYKVHTVSSLDSQRTNKDNIDALIRKYGKDSNVCRVRIFGEFPKQDDDAFIGIELVQQAIFNDLAPDNEDEGAKKAREKGAGMKRLAFGVDVARFGNDETVIVKNASGNVYIMDTYKGQNLMVTVGKVIQQYRIAVADYPLYYGKIYVNIDDCGLGGGVTDRLNEVKHELSLDRMEVVPVNAAERVPDDLVDMAGGKNIKACDFYENMTTYMWAAVREAMYHSEIRLPEDNEMIAQFTARKYTVSSRGRIVLESKEDMKKRGLDSPDRADAVALSCFERKGFDINGLIS